MAKKTPPTTPATGIPGYNPKPAPVLKFDAKHRPVDADYGMPINTLTRKTCILLIDVVRSNPNGDPDNESRPRQDVHGHGLIRDASLKRVVRDEAKRYGERLYIERGSDLGVTQEHFGSTERILDELWDARLFGGVFTLDRKMTGPMQFEDARSVLPIDEERLGLTRVADHASEKQRGDGKGHGSMGHYMVTSGLYMARGFYNPFHAVSYPSGTGVTEHDLAVFWGSLIEGWQNNRSAHRTGVNLRRLYVFDHPTMRGVEQSHITAARVSVVPRSGMHTAWSDYTITVNDSGMPEGMLLYTWADDAALGTLASYPIATAK